MSRQGVALPACENMTARSCRDITSLVLGGGTCAVTFSSIASRRHSDSAHLLHAERLGISLSSNLNTSTTSTAPSTPNLGASYQSVNIEGRQQHDAIRQ